MIARSVDLDRYLGKTGTSEFREGITDAEGTFHRGRTLEGLSVFTAYERSRLSGWVVSFAVPDNYLNRPLQSLTQVLVLMGGLAVFTSVLAAVLYGRMISKSLDVLAGAARRVGNVEFLSNAASRIVEIDEVAQVLSQANADLRRKDIDHRILLHELDHRVKNTLAIVQSLVTQSLRSAESPEHFRVAISGRVIALARSHEVLSAANWDRPEMVDVANMVLGRANSRISYGGVRVKLSASAVVAFTQCLHELLTNAQRHGSLQDPEGSVTLSWRLAEDGNSLAMSWVEINPHPPAPRRDDGLGLRIVRICIERQLGGTCRFDFCETGLTFEALVPLQSELGRVGEVLPE